MAVKLNLIPEELTLSDPVTQIVKFVQPLNVVLLALFLITGLGMTAFFIFSSVSLNDLNISNQKLIFQIQTQNSAQQQMVLLKDRISKIKIAQSVPNSTKNLTNIIQVLDEVSGNSLVSELDVDPQRISGTFAFKTNSDLTNFIKQLGALNTFISTNLETFSYNPASGYLISMGFVPK